MSIVITSNCVTKPLSNTVMLVFVVLLSYPPAYPHIHWWPTTNMPHDVTAYRSQLSRPSGQRSKHNGVPARCGTTSMRWTHLRRVVV